MDRYPNTAVSTSQASVLATNKVLRNTYLLLGAMQDGQTGPRGKLPARPEIAAKLGVHPMTVARAHRELVDMGLIYLVPGYGYLLKASTLVS